MHFIIPGNVVEIMDLYKKLSDRELFVLLKETDQQAYTEIYERYHSLLYSYAYKRLKNQLEAQDVVQDVLITLWDKREDLTLKQSLASYLYAMVRNKSLDLFARKKVEDKYLLSLQHFMDSAAPADYLIREKDMDAFINKEIDALPPRMREIFKLSRKERLTNKEIAALLEISPHTVDTQIKRALKVLRLKLGPAIWLLVLLYY